MRGRFTMRGTVLAAAGIAVTGGVILGATGAFAASTEASASVAAAASTEGASAAATSTSTTGAGKGACAQAAHPARCAARRDAARDRAALFQRGAHGQATVKDDKTGAYVVREWQVGKVGSISGANITVTDGSGATWTWTADSATTYRVDGAKGALSGVHVGDTILIRGQRDGGANDAKGIADPDQSKLASVTG